MTERIDAPLNEFIDGGGDHREVEFSDYSDSAAILGGT